jgi:uncharacterized protein YndB with AHSA1/START domain
MKLLKKVLIVVVSIIALLLITALFVKNDYTIEREMTIAKPKEDVFNYVKYVKNQDHYNKWVMMDPSAKKEYKGDDGTVGFVSSWESKDDKVGKGEQEITALSEGKRIDLGLHFIKPFESKANSWMVTEDAPNGETRLKWGMAGTSAYPMNLMNLFIDGVLGNDMETSLVNLKTVLEKAN